MSIPRTSAKPVSCKYLKAGNGAITKAHENRHFAVELDDVATGLYDHPTVKLIETNDANPRGELLNVDTDTEECSVLMEGLMYFRAGDPYAASQNGQVVLGTTTDGVGKASATGNGPIIEGGFTIDESGTTVNILKARR